MTIRTRIMLFSFVIAVIAVIVTVAADQINLRTTEDRLETALNKSRDALWNSIVTNQMNRLALSAPAFLADTAILDSLQAQDRAALANHVRAALDLQLDEVFTTFYIVDPAGSVLFTTKNTAASTSVNSKLVQEALRQGQPVRGMQQDSDGHPSAAVVFPFVRDGKLLGAGIVATDLHEALGEFKRHNLSETFVRNLQGTLTYSSADDLFQGLELPAKDRTEFHTAYQKIGGKIYTVSVQPLLDNEHQLIAQLISASDTTEQLTAQQRVRTLSQVATAAGVGAMLIGISWYLRRSFTPLHSLLDVINRVASGETSTRAVAKENDEVGQLARAFNRMAEKLEKMIDHERQHAEDVTGKVELIREVVEGAAHGDLTGQLMVYRDNDVISDLASGIQGMLDSLNNLVARIQQSGIQVTSSATEIAATAKQQEATVSEQAATTNEIRATVTQISATSRELVNTMHEVTDVAFKTAESANQGRTSLSRMEETMRNMMEATTAIGSKLAVLSEKAGNINTVVTTINKVSDQTNLLSLNAAIEAEKAGEYGVGFAVVATEIRRLADQTAVATWDIEQMVKEMQSAVSAGVMGMEKFSTEVKQGVDDVRRVGAQLAHIIEQVEHLIPRFEEVHEGMQSQSKGAEQISEAMVQLAESSQQTAESLRQSNGAIGQLNEAARRLQEGVSHFKVSSHG